MNEQPDFILATDLDGTFLGGPEADRLALYRRLKDDRRALLIFVTGRDIDFVRELVAQPHMPRPRYVIGDVGTSVFDGETLEPVAELEAEIVRRWGDAGERVKAMLADEPGLILQPTPFRHRVSYDYDSVALSPEAARKVEAAGFDCLMSAGVFFDVLPKGVCKGPTLLRLIEALGLPRDRVLVAGDTMNDLSLFETGLKGVAVGGSEPRLLEALAGHPHVHRARGVGAAGIAEAMARFSFLELEGAQQ